jgi:hypothetical protein
VLHSLLTWGERHRFPNSRVFKHADCGTRLDENGGCPACGVRPAPEDIVMQPRRGRGRLRTDPVAVALRGRHRLLDPVES